MRVRGGSSTRKRKRKGSVVKTTHLVSCSLLAAALFACEAQAVPSIEVNGIVSAELAPPGGVFAHDAEAGSPLARDAVTVADARAGVWEFSAVSDISVPKLAIFGSLDNSAGGALSGPFGGEVPLMRVNASLNDTISITAPSADPYVVTAELEIDGVLKVSGSDGVVNALITMDPVDRLGVTKFTSYSSDLTVVDDKLPISFQFTGDAHFDLRSSLFFFVSHVDAGATVLANFSNTAIINLTVTTLDGTVIPDVVVSSDSGHFGVAPVPLPATLPLLAVSLLGMAAGARRRAGRRGMH